MGMRRNKASLQRRKEGKNSQAEEETYELGNISFQDYLPNSIIKSPALNHASHTMNT